VVNDPVCATYISIRCDMNQHEKPPMAFRSDRTKTKCYRVFKRNTARRALVTSSSKMPDIRHRQWWETVTYRDDDGTHAGSAGSARRGGTRPRLSEVGHRRLRDEDVRCSRWKKGRR